MTLMIPLLCAALSSPARAAFHDDLAAVRAQILERRRAEFHCEEQPRLLGIAPGPFACRNAFGDAGHNRRAAAQVVDSHQGICADLTRQSFVSAELHEALLSCADLEGADLRGANLILAELPYADLRDADLRGADLTGAKLEGARLEGARYDERTKLPFPRDEAARRGLVFTPTPPGASSADPPVPVS